MSLKLKILLLILTRSPVFIIKIENGALIKIKGAVKSSFMADCLDILNRGGVKQGLIYAVKDVYGKPVLHVTSEVPADVLQQLRNTWNLNA